MEQDPLSQLRDIHLPEPGGFWPPAFGWWILLALLLLLVIAALAWWLRRRHRHRWKAPALERLEQLEAAGGADNQWFSDLNETLKRGAMVCHSSRYPESLSGEQWVHFLEKTWPTSSPPTDLLNAMVAASWQSQPQCQPNQALYAARTWIRGQSC